MHHDDVDPAVSCKQTKLPLRMRNLGHFQITEWNGLTTGVSLVQSVPMGLVIAYGPQGDAHVCRRMKCPCKDPPGRIAGYFHKTKVEQGKLSDDTSF